MGEIGWAFIAGRASGGEKGSVQYNDGDTWITGSNNFKYLEDSNTVVVSSSVFVSGTLYANDYHVNTINETVTNISSQGSTIFGNSADDTHAFTGSTAINGNFEVIGSTAMFSSSAGSDLIFQSGSTFYSASNEDVPIDATFVRADSPALIVSGTAVFNDPVSIQGGLYGASPIQVYAPLSFASVEDPNIFHSIEPGKITGDIEIQTDGTNRGLLITGNSGISIEGDFNGSFTSYKTLQNTPIEQHPNMNLRQAIPLINDLTKVETKIPIFIGDNQEEMSDYILEDVVASRISSMIDLRRNCYVMSFDVMQTSFDADYESHEAVNHASLTSSATSTPFTTSDYTDLLSPVSVMKIGAFGDVGDGNKQGIKRGVKIAGNITPMSFEGCETSDLSIGHPSSRWGDVYISNEKKITWGTNKDKTQWYADSLEESSASFGYEAASDSLVVDGSRLKVNNSLQVNSTGYVNFGHIKDEDGYGFRDLGGQIQFKNQTGDWADFQSIFGGSSGGAGALQLSDGNGEFSSNSKLTFANDTLTVEGTIVANELIVNTIDQTVVNISMTGSTSFGDSADDTHNFVGSMNVSGALTLNRKVITDNYTLLSTDHFVGVDSATNITIQLPLASELNDGQFFTIKDENGGENKEIILQCSGSDNIDGESAISLTSPYTAVNLYSNGQNKFFIF